MIALVVGGFFKPLLPLVARRADGSGVALPALVTVSCLPESVSATKGASSSYDRRLLRRVSAALGA